MANRFRATGPSPCDRNIFRPKHFPLASENTDVPLVNHPVLMQTSDQPSLNSVNFPPSNSTYVSPSFRYQSCAELKLKSSSWNYKENNKFVVIIIIIIIIIITVIIIIIIITIIIIIGIQLLGRFGQRPELSQATGMALVRCNLGKFLGVVCHCFPPRLDVPTFDTRS